MTDLWTYLKNCNKPIALYGTGNGADKVIDKLNNDGTEICGIFAFDDTVPVVYDLSTV